MVNPFPEMDLETASWALDEGPEADYVFYKRFLTPGRPALEAGCGAGRLLLDYLADGYEVDGCDLSAAMLAACRDRSRRRGLAPRLFHLPMQDLGPGRAYAVVYVACGTFMCLTDPAEARRALAALTARLEAGGRLIVSLLFPGHRLPSPWEHYYTVPLPAAGGEIVAWWRARHVDDARRVVHDECRYELRVAGTVVRVEQSPGRYRWYDRAEMEELLAEFGYRDVAAF